MQLSKLLLVPLLSLFACSTPEHGTERYKPSQPLQEKYEFYRDSATYYADVGDCDALLFDSLIAVGRNQPGVLDIDNYRDSNWKWYRNPEHNCYPERSKSSISRDMFVGLLFYAHKYRRLDIAENLIRYAEQHGLIMGDGPLSRTLMTPNLLRLAAEVSHSLGGPSHGFLRNIPLVWGGELKGFQAHLQVLQYLLLREIGISNSEGADLMQKHFRRVPQNPLFAIAAGHPEEAERLLLNPALWPDNELPSTANYCSPWLTQREPGPDWEPCPDENEIHTGGDFLFAAYLLVN